MSVKCGRVTCACERERERAWEEETDETEILKSMMVCATERGVQA